MMDEELTAHAEKSDGYHGVIIRLNAGWRISICDTGIQWILQERTGTAKVLWRPRGYCRTSEAIRRLARQHAGKIDPEAQAALNRLPAWIEEVDHELDHQDAVDVDRVDGACLPSKVFRPPSGPLWVHEIKHDGYRLMVRRDGLLVRCFTRNGQPLSGHR